MIEGGTEDNVDTEQNYSPNLRSRGQKVGAAEDEREAIGFDGEEPRLNELQDPLALT